MAFALCSLLFLLAACKKEYKVDGFEPSRLFTPGAISVANGETMASLSWSPSLFAGGTPTQYTVEVSQDPNFAGTAPFTAVVDTPGIKITDADITIKQDYFARIRANAKGNSAASNWAVSESFRITGEQIFFPVNDAELKDKTAMLRWRPYAGLTKIALTEAGGSPIDIALTGTDVTDAFKLLENLKASTVYTAEIYKGSLVKGIISFTTKEPSIYTTTITPADDLVAVVANAADGDVIGLAAGEYNIRDAVTTEYVNLIIQQKTLTIAAISGTPADTKVNFKEVVLKGTGAGVIFKDLEFDGAPATTAGQQALYFVNLVGNASDAEAATFTTLELNNCIVRNMGNCLMRGNRAANNAHKIGSIKLSNSQVLNSAQVNSNYGLFTINKLEFGSIELSNSTFHKVGRAFIDWSTTLTVSTLPVITMDHCTLNTFGMQNGNKYILVDGNGSNFDLTIRNSILANSPYPGETCQPAAIRSGSGATMLYANNNSFNLTSGGATPAALTFPALVVMQDNLAIDLGWTDATVDFSLPPASALRTASSTGGPIGDPRWSN